MILVNFEVLNLTGRTVFFEARFFADKYELSDFLYSRWSNQQWKVLSIEEWSRE